MNLFYLELQKLPHLLSAASKPGFRHWVSGPGIYNTIPFIQEKSFQYGIVSSMKV